MQAHGMRPAHRAPVHADVGSRLASLRVEAAAAAALTSTTIASFTRATSSSAGPCMLHWPSEHSQVQSRSPAEQQQQQQQEQETSTSTSTSSNIVPLVRKHARKPAASHTNSGNRSADTHRQLTVDIMAARTWQQAGRIFEQSSDKFNHINTVALITRLAKLPTPRPPLQQDGARGRPHAEAATLSSQAGSATNEAPVLAMQGGMPGVTQSIRNQSAAAAAALGAANQSSTFTSAGDSHQESLSGWASTVQRPILRMAPTQASTSATAAATARPNLIPLSKRALAVETMQPVAAAQPAALRVSSRANEEDWLSFESLLEELQVFAESMLPRMGARELANTAHGLATMRVASRRLLQLVISHSGRKLSDLKSQEAANLLWALAKAEHPPPQEWLLAFVDGPLTRLLPSMRNQELSNVIWAMGKLQCHPGDTWLQAAMQELAHRGATLRPQDVSNALVGLAKLHWSPAAPLLLTLLRAGLTNGRPSQQEIAQMLWSIGEMHVKSAVPLEALRPALHAACTHLRQQATTIAASSPSHVASVVASLARIRYCPEDSTCTALMEAVQPRLRACTALDLGDLLWGVAVLHKLGGPRPSGEWLLAAEAACTLALPSSLPRTLCRQAWAFAALQHCPGGAWKKLLQTQVVCSLPVFSDAEVAVSLWALAKLHSSPRATPGGNSSTIGSAGGIGNLEGVNDTPSSVTGEPVTFGKRQPASAGPTASVGARCLRPVCGVGEALSGATGIGGGPSAAWLAQLTSHLLDRVEGKQRKEAKRTSWRDAHSGRQPPAASLAGSPDCPSNAGDGKSAQGSDGSGRDESAAQSEDGKTAAAAESNSFSAPAGSAARVGIVVRSGGKAAGLAADRVRRRALARAASHRLPLAQRLHARACRGGSKCRAGGGHPLQGTRQGQRQQEKLRRKRQRQQRIQQQQWHRQRRQLQQQQAHAAATAAAPRTATTATVIRPRTCTSYRSIHPAVPSAGIRCDLGTGPGARLRHLALLVWALPQLLPRPAASHSRRTAALLRPLLRRLAAASMQPLQICAACHACAGPSPSPTGPFTPSTLIMLASGLAALRLFPGWRWLAAHRAACVALGPAFNRKQRQALRQAYHALYMAAQLSTAAPQGRHRSQRGQAKVATSGP